MSAESIQRVSVGSEFNGRAFALATILFNMPSNITKWSGKRLSILCPGTKRPDLLWIFSMESPVP